jgi:uncharacterized protein (TIGR03067 family)
MTARYAVVVAVMLPLASGFGAAGGQKDDKDQLQGDWVVVSMERGGTKLENTKDRKLVVNADKWTAPGGGEFTFKIDATKSPKQLDLMLEKNGKESTWQGIYKIEGDTLTFCRSFAAGGERPTEFKGGPAVFLMVCKRAGK